VFRLAVFLCLVACQGSRSVPPASGRGTAPSSTLATTALRVGDAAPEIALTDAAGAPWTLSDAQAKHARVMLVFYRGDW
jgi:hypothetical protein